MANYRLKRVFTHGRHSFQNIHFDMRCEALEYADSCARDEEVVQIDLYMLDKKIATFYK